MEPKRLYRSRKERVIGGVCGGLANYFYLDPVLMRFIWAVLFFFGGIGLVAYLLAWIIIPEEPIINP
jgi:phage shock protein PspC (stress-responsive transcriptional regulator)